MTKKDANCLSVKKKQIKEAVNVLKEYVKKWDEENPPQKKSLLEEPGETPILLSFTLKKIPELSKIQMIRVPLPHTLVTDETEVCLFTGDLDKRDTKADVEPTILHYKELLSKHGVTCVSEVIPLRQLRTEYKPFEAKRNLCGAYDYFLVDNKVSQCLPRILGKFFFKKRKFPQQISLVASNLKNQIENALSKTVFFLTGRGNSCSAEVAHLGFDSKQIAENVEAAINTLAANIPGTWKNINGLYIKTPRSVSIPVYLSSESGNDVELPPPETVEDIEAEELTTLMGYKVKVYKDGNIEVIKTDEDSSDNETDRDYVETLLKNPESLDEEDRKRRKTKKKKISLSDSSDEGEEDEEEEETSERKEKLKRKVKVDKTKAVIKKKKNRYMDAVDDETETVVTKNKDEEEESERKKLKKVKVDKTKKVGKKKRYMDAVDDDMTETVVTKKKNKEEDEESEILSERKEKLKNVKVNKAKMVVKKKKKRYMDAVNDDETETVVTKKKSKVSK